MSLVSNSLSSTPFAPTLRGATSADTSTKAAASGSLGAADVGKGGASTSSSSTPASTAAPSATVTLSPQALSMSHAMSEPAAASSAASATSTTAPAADSPSIYDDVKHGIAAAVEGVGDAIGGTASFIGHGVEAVVSGVDSAIHGALDLPFALGAEACNAAGAVLDAL